MMEYKRLKDPIYGYIDMPKNYMNDIIDTAEFQRLRRIIQTSYSPLYSSAVHNRFVHSMGVYYLGDIACQQLEKEIEALGVIEKKELISIGKIFRLACLLHDVGHAPFSHTGENFYLDEDNGYVQLHTLLMEVVNSDTFSESVRKENIKPAAPHEIMSSIIGIKIYEGFFDSNEQKEFFARCITGYKYPGNDTSRDIKNCFIEMLNSKIIDVDKLDYLIRDAYITGFNTVDIDFERLLTSLTVVDYNGHYQLAYYKNAISVIENVVYAHDSERKWIQTHPVVLYEMYLLRGIISNLNKKTTSDNGKLFSLESLSKEGSCFGSLGVSLMSDDDIVFLMKNIFPTELSKEFFERKTRRHPVWKSEAEYKAIVLDIATGGWLLDGFEKAMEDTIKYLEKNTDSWVINEELIKKLEEEIIKIKKSTLDDESKKGQLEDKNRILKLVNCLKEYATEKDIECDFVILEASQFNSGFGKSDFAEINIVFKKDKKAKPKKVGEIVSSLKAAKQKRDNFFYLFYKRNNKENKEVIIDKEEICKCLFKAMF